ncbi:MAG: substrate-binding domain-containing protein [Brevundimonas sp.]|uniref:substrate-binding domain-containing protein n=1 Tax=Brevundimonas sp. TaxID=1871086 RepID=UPI00261671D4|nr:substrate-binding domain-containing protein [Brevundimonas sp.]MDI6625299.1 substrate-binding domain-containing protein [Brevundimonas sp.]MDQ7812069.1 substrate-binding domain-containing protein [Brevundimonas sp.]
MTRTLFAATSAIALLALGACGDNQTGGAQGARAGIWAAGSSTVFPFTTRVAENFARTSGGAAPRVESLGTGGGIQAFCQGTGPTTPDIANASRRMKKSEFEMCQANGVTDIVELKIGYDGLVIATALDAPDYGFEGDDLYLALAKEVPGPNGSFIANPNTTWSQVNPGLPASRIMVYGPPPTSGTRDSWLELAMAPSAETIPQLAALAESDEDRFETLAHTLREDGAWIDSGENDNAIVQTLTRTPGSTGVFGYSFLEQNADSVKAHSVNGVMPTPETIASGAYPVSRSMFIYVKKAHVGVTPGLKEFVLEYMSDAAAGRGGYLQDRGLVPLPAEELAAQRALATAMTSMASPE